MSDLLFFLEFELGERIADVLWQSTTLLALVLWALRWLPSPAARVALARATLIGLCVLPWVSLTPGWPRWSPWDIVASTHGGSGVESAPGDGDAHSNSTWHVAVGGSLTGDRLATEIGVASNKSPISAVSDLPPWRLGVAIVAIGASIGAILWNLYGAWLTYHLLRTARPAPQWLVEHFSTTITRGTPARLMISDQVHGAMVLGLWRPTVLVPPVSTPEQLDDAALDAALRHEWAHIEHGDLRWLVIERFVAAIYAAQPLMIALRRTMRLDQELLADASAAGDEPWKYAEALMAWARSSVGRSPSSAVSGLSSGRHFRTVKRRLSMLLESPRLARQRVTWRFRFNVGLLLLAALAGVSVVSVQSKRSTAEEPPAAKPAPPPIRPAAPLPPAPATDKPPGSSSTSTDPRLPARPQVILEIVAARLDRETLAAVDESLHDMIFEASEERCRQEGQAIVAPVRTPRFHELLKKLVALNAAKIVSRPQLVTSLDKSASLFTGGELPIVEVREFDGVKGELVPPQVESLPIGLRVDVTVSRQADSPMLQVDFLGKYSTLFTPSSSTNSTRVLDTYRMQLANPVEMGETLVVLNRNAPPSGKKDKSMALRPDLLFAVTLLKWLEPGELPKVDPK